MTGDPQGLLPRALGITARRLAQHFPIIAIVGPRQSGKTTLARQVFAEHAYVNLEDPAERAWAQRDPRAFLARFPAGVVLDEVQRAPDLFSLLQVLVDERRVPGRFVLTGSHQFGLVEAIVQSLAGRVAILRLLPLALDEWPATQATWEERLFAGAFPGPLRHGIAPTDWMPHYVATYLERDVRLMRHIGDLLAFHRFLELCAGRSAQVLDLSSLASDAGISPTTARAWLSVLEASLLVHLLPAYHRNFGKRLTKRPKLHLLDSGLHCHLLGIRSVAQLRTHPLRGAIFESWAVSEAVKQAWNRGREARLFHWRDQHGHEVDLVLERGDGLDALELKSGLTATPDDARTLRWWRALGSSGRSAVCYGGEAERRDADLDWVPWRRLDRWLDAVA